MSERPCTVCQHGSRFSIDQAILNGKGLRAIARDFSIGSGQPGTDTFKPDHKKVQRHRDKCMGEAYQAAVQENLEASGLALVNRMKELDEAVDEALKRARDGYERTDGEGIPLLHPKTGETIREYDDRVLLAAVREARRNVEMRAKLSGATPDTDPEALERQRELLKDPKARRLMAELDALLGQQDQELPG